MTTQTIWNLYAEDVKRFILAQVKDATATDDLLQDTFIKIHTKKETLKDEAKMKAWIFSIARYTVMDYFREHKMPYSESQTETYSEIETNKHTEHDCLYGILKQLPKKYRDPLFLADIKGLKQAEVAKELNVSLPTVKSQIQRARKLIAKGYMDCCDLKMNSEGFLVGEIKEKEDCKICNY
ncbi:sigma-70 family RNA polymerase sigma factor [Bizionia arctica]|uniref:DNA-directed RNA polymerase sigma-70 factor n=1 Tax=Bizionia arctica TaxID=1495645 RepID=A0A917GRN6_9FLAO|nr:sigma-70 family RNA polymerase sigma factor [Bizionia arctica]GGG55428.1 DNA-directed RNA polymerase sigma-70 factor [Bizionia arctica]